MPKFIVKQGAAPGQEVPIRGDRMLIGRSEDCDVVIVDANVSRHHAQVLVLDGLVALVDLNSSNGTYVNSVPISRIFLMNGDEVRLGETILLFVENGTPEPCGALSSPQRFDGAATGAPQPTSAVQSQDPLNQTRLFAVSPETLHTDVLKETYLKLKTLYRLFHEIAQAPTLQEIAEVVTRAALISSGVERVVLFVPAVNGESWQCLHQKVSTVLVGRESDVAPPAPALLAAAQEGAKIALGKLSPQEECVLNNNEPNAACFPVVSGTRVTAVLYADNPLSHAALPKDDIDFLATISLQLGVRLGQLSQLQRLRQENVALRRRVEEDAAVVTQNERMRQLLEHTMRVAESEATVLITGESGTGKELIARSIHAFSPRRSKPLIAVNCAALPDTLLESELFGHEKGAFTGAVERRIGKFELADGGTLFLDEIGDLSLSAQAKLLRVLQEGEIQRVGGQKTIKVDVRVVAATNKNLREEVRQGNFRQDLFYRIRVVELTLPPLRERMDDVPVLAEYFLQQLRRKFPTPVKRLAPETVACLMAYDYPGNVRELKNVIERGLVFARGEVLMPEDLPAEVLAAAGTSSSQKIIAEESPSQTLTLAEVERRHVMRVLEFVHGNKLKAAALLGISRTTLYEKLKEYGVATDHETK